MKVEFSNRQQLIAYGKVMLGYGLWGFEYLGKEFWTTGTLTEAKKACREHIKQTEDSKLHPYGVYVEIMS